MREPILKAVAMPPRVFWAPMIPAFVNAGTQLPLILMWAGLLGKNPLWGLWTILLVHIIIIIYSTHEPHLSHMMLSWGQNGPMTTRNMYHSKGNKFAP